MLKKGLVMMAFAFILLPSSWQIWRPGEDRLTVYYANTPTGEVCFDGKLEDYNGRCTNPPINNSIYNEKQQAIANGTWGK